MEENNISKVLFMIDTNVGGKGGAETHLWNLLSNIDKSRVSVDVIYFDADDLDAVTNREKVAGVNYYKIPVGKIFSISSIKYLREIFKIMRQEEYDCAISFFESSDIITAVLGRCAGIKTRISNRRDTGFRNSKKLEALYTYINKLFTGFIAVSEAVKDSIVVQNVNPEKVKVIYNAVDLNRFKNANSSEIRGETGIKADDMVFGMVANLNPVKNHSSVIDALSILHKEGNKSHLVLAGEGVQRNDLEQQVSDLNLTSFVHFLGTRDDVVNILAAFDVFILASLTEGLSNALLEAMASKKAVIATSVGGNVEVVVDGVDGALVSTDAVSISDAMRKLHASKKLRDEMGENSFKHVSRQFSLEQMLESYMNLIQKNENGIESVRSSF